MNSTVTIPLKEYEDMRSFLQKQRSLIEKMKSQSNVVIVEHHDSLRHRNYFDVINHSFPIVKVGKEAESYLKHIEEHCEKTMSHIKKASSEIEHLKRNYRDLLFRVNLFNSLPVYRRLIEKIRTDDLPKKY